jgi:FMN-dependent NADH-azoreductase
MNVLHLDSSILGKNSISRSLSKQVLGRLLNADPSAEVVYRDLAGEPIPHLSGATFLASMGAGSNDDADVSADVALGNEILEEFLAADTVIIGVPLYNFAVPTQLKAWVDRIAVKGRTFRYTETGPEGLVGDKRVVLLVSRGGVYGEGSPAAAFEHAETYMRAVFGFIGIQPTIIVAEGHSVGAAESEKAMADATRRISEVV